MKIDKFLKVLSNIVLGIVLMLVAVAIGHTVGESEGRKTSKQYYHTWGIDNKIIYTEPVHAFAFKVSTSMRAFEIYAPNFIIDNNCRDTVYASKFILTTEITDTP